MKKLFLAGAIALSVMALTTTHGNDRSGNRPATLDTYSTLDTIPKRDTFKTPWPDTTKKPLPPTN